MSSHPNDRTVVMHFPRKDLSLVVQRHKDREMWLSMLEMFLESEFSDYKITITEEQHRCITVEIEFSTIDDAIFFKLQH